MPEATALSFFVLALLCYDRWAEAPGHGLLARAGVSTALALLVKPTSICLGPPALATVVARQGWRVLRRHALWLTAVGSLVPLGLWLLHANGLYRSDGNTFGVLSGGDSKFARLSDLLSPSFYWALLRLEILWVFPGLAGLVAIAGAVQAWRRPAMIPVLVGPATLGVYYVVLGRYTQQPWGIQYHVYAIPFASVLFGIGCTWLLARLPGRLGHVSVAVVVASFVPASAYVSHGIYHGPPQPRAVLR